MKSANKLKFEVMSETDLEPVLKLLKGGVPDMIARQAGITKTALLRMRDDLLAQARRERSGLNKPPENTGRNEPCPCGSGKKYKHCCLEKHEAVRRTQISNETQNVRENRKEQDKLIKGIEKAFGMLGSGQYTEAIRFASKLLNQYPNEDRLHDIIGTSHLYGGDYEKAIEICVRRLKIAESEKSYFIRYGRYRDAETDKPAMSYFLSATDVVTEILDCPEGKGLSGPGTPGLEDVKKVALVKQLKTADNTHMFPKSHSQGLEMRKRALKETINAIKENGPGNIPYLLPLACKYSWSGLFVPEILAYYRTDTAIRALIDISMFGFAYASGASLHFLEKMGEPVVPYIEEAFAGDFSFDPIKTGIVSVLGNVKVAPAYELLVRLLEHESPHIVNWAGDALGKFKNVDALPAMVAANERIGGEKMIDTAILKLKRLDQ